MGGGGGVVFNDNPMFDVIAATIHTTTGVIYFVLRGGGVLMPVIPAIDVSGLTFDEFLLRVFIARRKYCLLKDSNKN